ncbi:MAG: hypothetical protein ACI855_001207, partial [Myxococcota bacterium]
QRSLDALARLLNRDEIVRAGADGVVTAVVEVDALSGETTESGSLGPPTTPGSCQPMPMPLIAM